MKIISTRFAAILMVISALWACSKNGEPELPFPETEEEIEESVKTTLSIDAIARPIIAQAFEDAGGKKVKAKSLAKKLREIEGVVSATAESDDIILIRQRDGVYINVLLDTFKDDYFLSHAESKSSFLPEASILTRSQVNVNDVSTIVSGDGDEGKVLMLLHNYSENLGFFSTYYPESRQYAKSLYDDWYNQLRKCGFQVDSLRDSHVTIDQFFGSNLEEYDVIIVNSHGNAGLTLMDGHTTSTTVLTSSRVGSFLSAINPNLALCMRPGGTFYSFTSPFLTAENPSLQDAFVLFDSCKSYHDNDLADAFFSCGAAVYGGFTESVDKRDGMIIIRDMIKEVGLCNEVDEAYENVKNNSMYQDGTRVKDVDIFLVHKDPDYEDLPCYLFNPAPFNLSSHKANSYPLYYDLCWEMHPSLANVDFTVIANHAVVYEGKGEKDGNVYTYSYKPNKPTGNKWRVIAHVKGDDGNEISVFRSEETEMEVRDYLILNPEQIRYGRIGTADDIENRYRHFTILNASGFDVDIKLESCPEGFFINLDKEKYVTIPANGVFEGTIYIIAEEEKSYSGTIVIESDRGTTMSLDVSGEVYYNGATVGYDERELVFQDVLLGETALLSLAVKNVGKHLGTLFKKDVRLSGDDCFSVVMPERMDIAAYDFQVIKVTFTPTEEGSFEATLSLTFDEREKYVPIVIKGTCRKRLPPTLSLSSPEIFFNEVSIGSTTVGFVDATNTGDSELEFRLYYSENDCIKTNNLDYTLAPTKTERLYFLFTPQEAKLYEGTILIVSNGEPQRQRIKYSGRGIIPVSMITLDVTSLELMVGESRQLKATVNPVEAYNKRVIWSSSNPSAVSVNDSGLVTALAKTDGVVTVFAVTEDSGKVAKCSVTVKDSLGGDHEGTGEEIWD